MIHKGTDYGTPNTSYCIMVVLAALVHCSGWLVQVDDNTLNFRTRLSFKFHGQMERKH